MNMNHRQKDLAVTYGVLIAFAVLVGVAAVVLSGCSSWQGIDVKVRPGGHPDTNPKVEPAPQPPPPKDDWAPPWFHRQPKREGK